jgi:hypothetical protein
MRVQQWMQRRVFSLTPELVPLEAETRLNRDIEFQSTAGNTIM